MRAGEIALLNSVPRQATVKAAGPTTLLVPVSSCVIYACACKVSGFGVRGSGFGGQGPIEPLLPSLGDHRFLRTNLEKDIKPTDSEVKVEFGQEE